MEILGIIPARGGSKSIPNKNIAEVAGKPLLAYTCEAALGSSRLTRVILDTDSKEIAEVGKKFGVDVPFMRSDELAQDDTLMIDVLLAAIKILKEKENYSPDVIVLLQPTSPLRTSKNIDDAVDLFMRTGADSVVSVVKVPHRFNPGSIMALEDGHLVNFQKTQDSLRRQDKPDFFGRNGPAVLAVKTDWLLKKHSFYGGDTRLFIMSEEDSIDIDTPFDLKIAEFLLKCRK